MTRGSAFYVPDKGSKHYLVRIPPPRIHLSAYATAGIRHLYKKLNSGTNDQHEQDSDESDHSDKEPGDYTNSDGHFMPQPDMPLLAARYRHLRIIGKGQSSIFIKAMDMFSCVKELVAIKVLNTNYYALGAQESDCIRRINLADPYDVSGTLRLKRTFQFGEHYCMVFELLCPDPLNDYFLDFSKEEKLVSLRQVARHVLQALGFLQKETVIHADLKPENILLKREGDLSSLKVVDFGNAIHCIHEELSLYYDDYELQTLLYRAPEVMFGLPFGLEIDLWSLGCILAELYLGKPLFAGNDKQEVLQKMVDLLGPLPDEMCQRGKFYQQLKCFTSKQPVKKSHDWLREFMNTGIGCAHFPFVDFLLKLLKYNPKDRLTIQAAACHPFLAPEVGIGFLMPSEDGVSVGYPLIHVDNTTYSEQPRVADEIQRHHLSSVQLLREGTDIRHRSVSSSSRQVAQVQPVQRDTTPSPVDIQSEASVSGTRTAQSGSRRLPSLSRERRWDADRILTSPTRDDASSATWWINRTDQVRPVLNSSPRPSQNYSQSNPTSSRRDQVRDLTSNNHVDSEVVDISRSPGRASYNSWNPPEVTTEYEGNDMALDLSSPPITTKSTVGLNVSSSEEDLYLFHDTSHTSQESGDSPDEMHIIKPYSQHTLAQKKESATASNHKQLQDIMRRIREEEAKNDLVSQGVQTPTPDQLNPRPHKKGKIKVEGDHHNVNMKEEKEQSRCEKERVLPGKEEKGGQRHFENMRYSPAMAGAVDESFAAFRSEVQTKRHKILSSVDVLSGDELVSYESDISESESYLSESESDGSDVNQTHPHDKRHHRNTVIPTSDAKHTSPNNIKVFRYVQEKQCEGKSVSPSHYEKHDPDLTYSIQPIASDDSDVENKDLHPETRNTLSPSHVIVPSSIPQRTPVDEAYTSAIPQNYPRKLEKVPSQIKTKPKKLPQKKVVHGNMRFSQSAMNSGSDLSNDTMTFQESSSRKLKSKIPPDSTALLNKNRNKNQLSKPSQNPEPGQGVKVLKRLSKVGSVESLNSACSKGNVNKRKSVKNTNTDIMSENIDKETNISRKRLKRVDSTESIQSYTSCSSAYSGKITDTVGDMDINSPATRSNFTVDMSSAVQQKVQSQRQKSRAQNQQFFSAGNNNVERQSVIRRKDSEMGRASFHQNVTNVCDTVTSCKGNVTHQNWSDTNNNLSDTDSNHVKSEHTAKTNKIIAVKRRRKPEIVKETLFRNVQEHDDLFPRVEKITKQRNRKSLEGEMNVVKTPKRKLVHGGPANKRVKQSKIRTAINGERTPEKAAMQVEPPVTPVDILEEYNDELTPQGGRVKKSKRTPRLKSKDVKRTSFDDDEDLDRMLEDKLSTPRRIMKGKKAKNESDISSLRGSLHNTCTQNAKAIGTTKKPSNDIDMEIDGKPLCKRSKRVGNSPASGRGKKTVSGTEKTAEAEQRKKEASNKGKVTPKAGRKSKTTGQSEKMRMVRRAPPIGRQMITEQKGGSSPDSDESLVSSFGKYMTPVKRKRQISIPSTPEEEVLLLPDC